MANEFGAETPEAQGHISSQDQAISYVEALLEGADKARVLAETPFPPNPTAKQESSVLEIRRRFAWVFMDKHGQAVGAMNAFRLTGHLSDRAFEDLTRRALDLLAPKVTGSVVL